jgi:dTMP kinase
MSTGRFPFLVVEGTDGTGKTTTRKGLFRILRDLYGVTPLTVLTTNYLDAAAVGDLVEGKYSPTPTNRERYLDALRADKAATLERLVLPALVHRPVIADRWLLSELVFFAVKHDQPPEATYRRLAEGLPIAPDLTVLLDLDPEESMRRAGSRSGDATRADWDVLDVQQRVRAAYTAITEAASEWPALGPIVSVDASATPAEVLHRAWFAIDAHDLLPALSTAPPVT